MDDNLILKLDNIRQGDPGYYWLNIELGKSRVGKARIKKYRDKIIIKSINIFPEYENRGIARQVVESFKGLAKEIIADRVRRPARGFWEHMEFSDCKDGNYRWVSCRK